ncbi:uncharacterized protein BYT42DRAFT_550150 [Radiomyces spectabilis]|uniref:uncharacterized protein n=1 Tax=Radiomyces spectabilis TaxID=64574 RepID=UPI00221FE202|nr:uncharacterized protein BYT42DRAFT_550150 [Radiomyces spectabilis]KAI8365259.1 hypothetical protein BYT42DRAFT_550150 [Radiomyces spectabilis]
MSASTESFKATVYLPALEQLLEIQVDKGHNVKDIVHDLVLHHDIPAYLTIPVLSALKTTIDNRNPPSSHVIIQQDKSSLRNHFVNHYQAHTLHYHNKPEEDIFPRAYHTLVHCPITSIFDALLRLEQSYALAIQELYTAAEHELTEIESRHAREIESSSSQGPAQQSMTNVFARHVEELELFQATMASDIHQTQQTQRHEYREFVVELYREYQARLSTLSDNDRHQQLEDALAVAEKTLDGKEIVATVAARMRQWTHKKEGTSIHSQRSQRSQKSHTTSQSHELASSPVSLRRGRVGSSASIGSQSHASPLASSPTEPVSLTRSASQPEKAAFQKMVKDIQEMGFSKEQAECALILTNNHMEQAVMLLVENPSKMNAALASQAAAAAAAATPTSGQRLPQTTSSTPYRRSSSSLSQIQRPTFSTASSPAHSRHSSWNESHMPASTPRRHSWQRMANTSAFLSLMGNSGTAASGKSTPGKGWSPISFLQQQKHAMENTNLSSVRKLGGWLGKAMENLGIEHDESDPRFGSSSSAALTSVNTQQLVESFSISLGTAQIKSSHNLRLLVADVTSDIFNPDYDPPREMAYHAQTATKLYTNHLSAMVVLVELSELKRGNSLDWRLYKAGKGSNKALFERCQHSTEFHFPDIDTQLSTIQDDFVNMIDELQEGTFFITRHSNLPLTQVIFHLIIDSQAVTTTELTNRHALIVGLRNILRLTTRFDISSLSIPLLLLPDCFLEAPEHHFTLLDQPQKHATWLQKRGEVIMKCVKGFLIENSRSGKRSQNEGVDRAESVFGGGMRNIEFLLPNHPVVYGQTHPVSSSTVRASASSQEVEWGFQEFRSLLTNIFRTN